MEFLISTLLAGLALLLSHQTPSTLYQSIAHDITDKTPVVSQSEIANTIIHSAPTADLSLTSSYPATKPEPAAQVSTIPVVVSNPTDSTVKQTVTHSNDVAILIPAVKGFEKAQVQIWPNPSARVIDLDQPAEDIDLVHNSLSPQEQQQADQELLGLLSSLGFQIK